MVVYETYVLAYFLLENERSVKQPYFHSGRTTVLIYTTNIFIFLSQFTKAFYPCSERFKWEMERLHAN